MSQTIYYSIGVARPKSVYDWMMDQVRIGRVKRDDCVLCARRFGTEVDEILDDIDGWRRAKGVRFVRVGENFGGDKINVWLTTPDDIDNVYCVGLDGMKKNNLSCANLRSGNIWVNLDRWMFGSDFDNVGLDEYRRYLINHEMGHAAFKLLHPTCDEIDVNVAPVMLQQTYNLCEGRLGFNPRPLGDFSRYF